MNKKALITGITGQDGAYLAEFLLERGYEVHGLIRRNSLINTSRIDHLNENHSENYKKLFLHYGDLTDSTNIIRVIKTVLPDEIYNLGAMSHVKVSFDLPEYTADVNGLGAIRILEAIRLLDLTDKCRYYQASTSELYGNCEIRPQNEEVHFCPRSPYAIAKQFAHYTTINYREAYNIFACNGILFNHESPIRGETFVTRKITRKAARIALGLDECMYLGNLDAKRDWGHAKDYVRAMWLMLQNDTAKDYVIATGKSTSIREVVTMAFGFLGVKLKYVNKGKNEYAVVDQVYNTNYNFQRGDVVVRIDKDYFRPTEVDNLVGDSSLAMKDLGWIPTFTLEDMIKEMLESDLNVNKKKLSHNLMT